MVHTDCPYYSKEARVFFSDDGCYASRGNFDSCDTLADNYEGCFWYICAEEQKNPRPLVLISGWRKGVLV